MGGTRDSLFVGLLEALLDEFADLIILNSLIGGFYINAQLVLEEILSIIGKVVGWHALCHIDLYLESDECAEELLVLANDHDIGAGRAELLEVVLDDQRGHIFATSCNNQLLNTPSNEQEAILVDLSQVTGMQEAIAVYGLTCSLFILKVAHHDVSASENDFTVTLLIGVVDLQVDSGQLESDRLQVELVVAVHGNEGSCL
jgi:hypothetical protein